MAIDRKLTASIRNEKDREEWWYFTLANEFGNVQVVPWKDNGFCSTLYPHLTISPERARELAVSLIEIADFIERGEDE